MPLPNHTRIGGISAEDRAAVRCADATHPLFVVNPDPRQSVGGARRLQLWCPHCSGIASGAGQQLQSGNNNQQQGDQSVNKGGLDRAPGEQQVFEGDNPAGTVQAKA